MPTLSLAKDSVLDLAQYHHQNENVLVKHYSFSQDGQVSVERLRGGSFDDPYYNNNNPQQAQVLYPHRVEERLEPISFKKPSWRKQRLMMRRRRRKQQQQRLFCCFFAPWSSSQENSDDGAEEESEEEEEEPELASAAADAVVLSHYHPMLDQDAYKSPDITRINNNSNNKKNAPNHVVSAVPNNDDSNNKTEEDEEEDVSSKSSNGSNKRIQQQQSILRFSSNKSPPPQSSSSDTTSSSLNTPSKRTFLPTSYQNNNNTTNTILTSPPKKQQNVSFSPMARTISIRSHNTMSMEERDAIWWNKTDFESFKRGNVIITKNIIGGGSEIWLSKQQSGGVPRKEGEKEGGSYDKWWHKYGHSRRGLEQAASGEEARQRQRNVRMATLAVLEEQKRQQTVRKPSVERLAYIAREYTAWAKDLALAAGESDADAVQSGFNDEKRHSREFYLLKHTIDSGCAVVKHTPPFMVPKGMSPKFLDANTSSGMLYRKRMQARIPPPEEEERRRKKGLVYGGAAVGRPGGGGGGGGSRREQLVQKKREEMEEQPQQPQQTNVTSSAPPTVGSKGTSPLSSESTEAIHDSSSTNNNNSNNNNRAAQQKKEESIAQRAAGFGGAGMDKISMAAVMSAQSVSFAQESPA